MTAVWDKLLDYIEDAGLSYKQNTVSWIFTCPRCRKDQKLYIRKRDGAFICWSCSGTEERYKGRPEYALADLCQRSVSEVKEALYGPAAASDENYFAIDLGDFFGDEDEVDSEAAIIPSVTWPHDYYEIDHPFSKRGREYLSGRGVPVELAREYGLRYAPRKRRVVFPIEVGDRLVGWQERAVFATKVWSDEKEEYVHGLKSLSSKGIPSAQTVMFANRLRGSEHVVLCEGPIDALKASLCGGNVATMGKAVAEGQKEFVRAGGVTREMVGEMHYAGIKRVYLALDPDAARETARLVREFSDLDVYLMHPPAPYEDLGEMSLEQVRELFLRAPRVSSANLFVYLE